MTKKYSINIAPITFSQSKIQIGRLTYKNEDEYKRLREEHWSSHAFRFDSRNGKISNVPISPNQTAIGDVETVEIQEHLLLMGKAIQQSILNWLSGSRPILRAGKKLTFWGGRSETLLLSSTLSSLGISPIDGIEVVIRYDVDARMFLPPGNDPIPYLGLVLDIKTSNIIDLPVNILLEKGVSVIGKYVCQKAEDERDYMRPQLDLVGMVSDVQDGRLLLTDTDGLSEVNSDEVYLEPRAENLNEIIQCLFPKDEKRIQNKLREVRGPFSTAPAKLERIRQTLDGLRKKHQITLGKDVRVTFGDLISQGHPLFPIKISTGRPNLLFGPQGRKSSLYPDPGITNHGPYKYQHHKRNAPVIGVICEAANRGRVEQFVNSLADGYPDQEWQKTKASQKQRKTNPFQGGLIGKFRLSRVDFQFEEVDTTGADDYKNAAEKLLARLPRGVDLAIVQIRDSYKKLRGIENPYFVSKATFMQAGVPVQAITIENIEQDEYQLPYILNNIALASYAKLDGIPWLISTRTPASHELVIGLGYTELTERRLGIKERYVGITTIFQGDGRYMLWGLTREVEFDNYPDALLDNLRMTIEYVQKENNWQKGDNVLLTFHVYKPLKQVEIEAVKNLVSKLVADNYIVRFAFVDISHWHMLQMFDPLQGGKKYYPGGIERIKGKGVPIRGNCYQLTNRLALLQLIGPSELKTDEQGIPRPLLIDLHPDSDFTDLTYILRQIFHFTHMSWQSFFPASEPVTIYYSRLIARLLGNLRSVSNWDSTVLSVGSLRDRRWFL